MKTENTKRNKKRVNEKAKFLRIEKERKLSKRIRVIKNYKKARTLNAGESKQRETAKVVRSKEVKLQRAQGECLGIGSRRRTR